MKPAGDPETAVVVMTALPDPAAADRVAETLIEERLAACVTRIPGVRSTYRWKGSTEHTEEVLVLIKTRAVLAPVLCERLVAVHPYEVPEVLVLPAGGGYGAYMDWIVETTRSGEGE